VNGINHLPFVRSAGSRRGLSLSKEACRGLFWTSTHNPGAPLPGSVRPEPVEGHSAAATQPTHPQPRSPRACRPAERACSNHKGAPWRA